MHLNYGLQLGYCTNIHRGDGWAETFCSLKEFTNAVRQRVSPKKPYGIGLRLSDRASRELSDRATILAFRKWLDANNSYVFTINGFPFGRFHGHGVKEQVYLPDWTSPDRLEYTTRLFDLLAQLLPPGMEGSVSTVPGSFKAFTRDADQLKAIRSNIFKCIKHLDRLCELVDRKMHLGLEPEPLCLLETTNEVVHFFERLRTEHSNDSLISQFLGITYDTCHMAVEFEDPGMAICLLRQHGIKISKLHLSSALSLFPTPEACAFLRSFSDQTYLHQVVTRDEYGRLTRYKDLSDVINLQTGLPLLQSALENPQSEEWRVHYHIPLHSEATELCGNTKDHLLQILDQLQFLPGLCSHLEMETYTWEVMPPELKNRSVVDQIASEYEWTLEQLTKRGLAQA